MIFQNSLLFAQSLDQKDTLAHFRNNFFLPKNAEGKPYIYFCGNSLGLQPIQASSYVNAVMDDWATLGVEGHVHAKKPWMPFHKRLTAKLAALVGGEIDEVVAMNSLTVNLHLLLVSFYNPTPSRYKILIEGGAFPSDRYAVASQLRFHGYDPTPENLLVCYPKNDYISIQTLESILEKEGDKIALILFGGVHYYTGQFFDIQAITELGHRYGCNVGFDLAHAIGNVPLALHKWNVDFAVWCSYKYLNAGPGATAGIFVHNKFNHDNSMKRFEGWWGHDEKTRFLMQDCYMPASGVERWQLSNPAILPMATLEASLELFENAGIDKLREKSVLLTKFCEFLISSLPQITIITPNKENERGAQLSIRVKEKAIFEKLSALGVICDWREPDVIRIAPVPLYNTFEEVYLFSEKLKLVL